MANINTVAVSASYEVLTSEVSYPLVRCEARPITAGLAPALFALLADIATCAAAERKLVLQVERAEVAVFLADEGIDGSVDAVAHACLAINGNDRTAEPYITFFKHKPPAELKEPVLEEELGTVKLWVEPLQTSIHPSLSALAPTLAAQIEVADKAKAMLDAANVTLQTFREQGARKVLVDAINAKRMATHGALGEIAHSNPQLMLPINFADRFFVRETRRRRVTRKEVATRLEAAKNEVAALEAKLAKLDGDAAAAAAKLAAQNAKEHQQKLAAAQKKADEAAAKLAALQQQT